jgi:hypothetical protein
MDAPFVDALEVPEVVSFAWSLIKGLISFFAVSRRIFDGIEPDHDGSMQNAP